MNKLSLTKEHVTSWGGSEEDLDEYIDRIINYTNSDGEFAFPIYKRGDPSYCSVLVDRKKESYKLLEKIYGMMR